MIEVKPFAYGVATKKDFRDGVAPGFCADHPRVCHEHINDMLMHEELVDEFRDARVIALYDQSTIDALQARIAELEKDAGRYRWLRDEGQFWGQLQILFDRREPNEWDRHIDETRASIDASGEKAYARFEAALGKNDAAIKEKNDVDR